MNFEAGTKVEILERGEWVGPFVVTEQIGRTPDHLVLANVLLNGTRVLFEQYNDAPFNIRKA